MMFTERKQKNILATKYEILQWWEVQSWLIQTPGTSWICQWPSAMHQQSKVPYSQLVLGCQPGSYQVAQHSSRRQTIECIVITIGDGQAALFLLSKVINNLYNCKLKRNFL